MSLVAKQIIILIFLSILGFSQEQAAQNAPGNQAAGSENAAQKENDKMEFGPVVDKSIDYSPVGKRDPFQSFIEDLKQAQESMHDNPLQRYELSQLKLIGIISNIPIPKAMFEDPAGKAWIVKAGANIGRHFGKIKRISEDTVSVVEEYHDRFGKLTINEVQIKINTSYGKEGKE